MKQAEQHGSAINGYSSASCTGSSTHVAVSGHRPDPAPPRPQCSLRSAPPLYLLRGSQADQIDVCGFLRTSGRSFGSARLAPARLFVPARRFGSSGVPLAAAAAGAAGAARLARAGGGACTLMDESSGKGPCAVRAVL